MNKIGIVVNNLGPNQLAYFATKYVNELVENSNVEPTIFYENVAVPYVKPLCATTCFNEAYSYNGLIITTTLSQAAAVLKFPNNSHRILYWWDLEWLRQRLDYMAALNIVRSQHAVFTRGESYATAIGNFANIPVGVIEDFNLIEMLGRLYGRKENN